MVVCGQKTNPLKKIFIFFYRMLRQSWRKQHLINLPPPPPKKKAFFLGGGGVSFLEYFHEFWGLEHKTIFGKTLGQSRCFGIIIGQFRNFPPFYDFGKFNKSGIFSIFGQIWQLFFFKIRFWTKLVLKPLKMVFLTFFRSWRWFILYRKTKAKKKYSFFLSVNQIFWIRQMFFHKNCLEKLEYIFWSHLTEFYSLWKYLRLAYGATAEGGKQWSHL